MVVFDRRDNQDQIDIVPVDQLLGIAVGAGDAESRGRFPRALLVDVADGDQLDPLFGVRLRELRQNTDQRQAAAADETGSHRSRKSGVESRKWSFRRKRARVL